MAEILTEKQIKFKYSTKELTASEKDATDYNGDIIFVSPSDAVKYIYTHGEKFECSPMSTYHFIVGKRNNILPGDTSNGETYLKTVVYDSGTKTYSRPYQFLIRGTGGTTVTSDYQGNITINSEKTDLSDIGVKSPESFGTKMYLVGTQTQSSTAVDSYSQAGVYAQSNILYSNYKPVANEEDLCWYDI